MVILTNQGQQNKDQTRAQIEKQDRKNDVELGSEFQIGNSGSQSQKKSGRQANKRATELSSLVLEGSNVFSLLYDYSFELSPGLFVNLTKKVVPLELVSMSIFALWRAAMP